MFRAVFAGIVNSPLTKYVEVFKVVSFSLLSLHLFSCI